MRGWPRSQSETRTSCRFRFERDASAESRVPRARLRSSSAAASRPRRPRHAARGASPRPGSGRSPHSVTERASGRAHAVQRADPITRSSSFLRNEPLAPIESELPAQSLDLSHAQAQWLDRLARVNRRSSTRPRISNRFSSLALIVSLPSSSMSTSRLDTVGPGNRHF